MLHYDAKHAFSPHSHIIDSQHPVVIYISLWIMLHDLLINKSFH